MTVATAAPSLASVAALGLAGTEHSAGETPIEPDSWRTFRAGVRNKRLTGLLLAAADNGSFPTTAEQRDDLTEDHLESMSAALVLESLLLDVVAHLEGEGIDVRVLKGAAVAHLDYAAPEQRAYGDVDLLVRSEQIDHTVRTLTEMGLDRAYQPPNAAWDRRFGKGATFRADDGCEIDLHRTLTTPPLGLRIQLADLWSSSEPLVLGGQPVSVLPRELRLLNAAYSAAASDIVPAPATLRDIAQMALHPSLDVALVRRFAHEWGGQAVLASAVNAAWGDLRIGDVTALSSWAERYRPSEDERRELALYQRVRAGETARALATARMLPGLSSRATYLWALARPDKRFAQAGRTHGLGRLTRAASDLRRARRSP